MTARTMDARAFAFFRANAGGVVGESAISAALLARAESKVRASDDYRYQWVPDQDADVSWMSKAELALDHECEGCILEHRCASCGQWEQVQSFWGIVDADDSYRRVIEADLASQVNL